MTHKGTGTALIKFLLRCPFIFFFLLEFPHFIVNQFYGQQLYINLEWLEFCHNNGPDEGDALLERHLLIGREA